MSTNYEVTNHYAHFTITAINLLTLFKKLIPVYAEIRHSQIQNAASLNGTVDGTHSYLSALN
jgi:hypothetical protein